MLNGRCRRGRGRPSHHNLDIETRNGGLFVLHGQARAWQPRRVFRERSLYGVGANEFAAIMECDVSRGSTSPALELATVARDSEDSRHVLTFPFPNTGPGDGARKRKAIGQPQGGIQQSGWTTQPAAREIDDRAAPQPPPLARDE